MKNYTLTQVKACETIEKDVVQFIRENGFRITPDAEELIPISWRGKMLCCYPSATISFSGLQDLERFVELVGECIISNDSITIYDDYIE